MSNHNDRNGYVNNKKNVVIDEENYVDKAEEVIKELTKGGTDSNNLVTTSKIRNLLSMTADIYNVLLNYSEEELSSEIKGKIEYLRVRFVYEAGREKKVKNLVEAADILANLKKAMKSRKNYLVFSRYMEALVAFHKFYGGKD